MQQLADTLKTRSEALHTAAERSALMKMFLKGKLTCEVYVTYLAALLPIYESLEEALLNSKHLGPLEGMADPRVFRAEALRRDLDVLAESPKPPVASATAYAERLKLIETSEPLRLIAHAYTRFLGDLNGGRLLKKKVGDALGLKEGAGMEFYRYEPHDVGELRKVYRERLQQLVLSDEQVEAITDETLLSFQLNHRVFDEVAALHERGLQTIKFR